MRDVLKSDAVAVGSNEVDATELTSQPELARRRPAMSVKSLQDLFEETLKAILYAEKVILRVKSRDWKKSLRCRASRLGARSIRP